MIPGHLQQFALLDRDEQATLIRRLATQGWPDHSIAGFTGRAVEDVRRVLGDSAAAEKHA